MTQRPRTPLPKGGAAPGRERNPFWRSIIQGLDRANAAMNTPRARYDAEQQAWAIPSVTGRWSPPALLQNDFFALDVTDHGLTLYPLILDGRYAFAVSFTLVDPAGAWRTLPSRLDDGVVRRVLIRPGSVALEATPANRPSVTVEISLLPDHPLALITVGSGGNVSTCPIDAEVWWLPGRQEVLGEASVWLKPRGVPLVDELTSRNNSRLPDPPRPPGLAPAGVGLVALGAQTIAGALLQGPTAPPGHLADRVTPPGLIRSPLGRWVAGSSTADRARTVIVGVGATAREFEAALEEWLAQRGSRPDGRGHWDRIGRRLRLSVPDSAIERQTRYSVHSSLFSRTTSEGRHIFIHGRRDRGLADVAHLHQSYQMHLVALAVGEDHGVRDEILRFASLQGRSGSITQAPRPGTGMHPYVGGYTDAHLILSTHRYVAWTGDWSILDEVVEGQLDGQSRTLIDRLRRVERYLLTTGYKGLMRPCGWNDSWSDEVRAQAQISITVAMALAALGDLMLAAGRPDAQSSHAAATRLRRRVTQVFYDRRTGLFAEQLFESGVVLGNTFEDFWAVTQVWAALAGLAPDARGLDAVRRECLRRGVRMAPAGILESDYLSRSRDHERALGIDSTATWMLAEWPELTHLYALAEIQVGRPDLALEALRGQLPERLHASRRSVPPWYYAEKYLYPGDRPWLCTWGGDPTLIEAILTGFLGVRPDLESLSIVPVLPAAWRDQLLEADFMWRRSRWHLTLDPRQPADMMTVDGRMQPHGTPIRPDGVKRRRHDVTVSTTAGEPR